MRWCAVAKLLRTEQLLQSTLLRRDCAFDEFCFKSVERISGWGREYQVTNLAAYSGERDETTYSNFVFCADILLVVNCASICANHSSGSAGQKGGSLMEMALAAATGGGSMGSASMGSAMGGSVGSGIETFVCCQGSPM